MTGRVSGVVARVRHVNETVQVTLGTAVAVLYAAAISLVGIEVMAILLESTLIIPFAAPLAPVIVIVLGTIAVIRRRAVRRQAGRTVAPGHVARGSRVRTRMPSRAPRNGAGSELVSRHP
jgi:hypothetical protein